MKIVHIVLALLFTFLPISTISHAGEPSLKPSNVETPNQHDLQLLGQQFNREIKDAYVTAHLNKVPSKDWPNTLYPIVIKFIPLGTSFKQAELILHYAKFGINTDPLHVPARPNEHHGNVTALLELNHSWFGYSGVNILLYPPTENEFTKISRIEAIYYGQIL